MSSVAVLTQESFNEHRSGLVAEQAGGEFVFLFVPLGRVVWRSVINDHLNKYAT